MKNVIIFHGYAETPESFWFPYVKEGLEKRGCQVHIPQLPNTNDPKLSEQLEYSLKNLEFTKDTIFIGHSSGCPLLLALLENISVRITQAICVAGYTKPLDVGAADTKNIKETFDWEAIKEHCQDFLFINGANDPWGANDKQGKIMFDNLGGTLIINKDGHMGSNLYKQPYKEFPLLLKLIA